MAPASIQRDENIVEPISRWREGYIRVISCCADTENPPALGFCKLSMNWTLILTFLSVALGYSLISLCHKFYKQASRFRFRHLPPGPPPLPIIGNLLDIPKTRPWIGYHKLSNEYGESARAPPSLRPRQAILLTVGGTGNLMLFRVFNQSLVIVNDAETATDLLEKRSGKYSSRPSSVLTKLYVIRCSCLTL